MTQGEKELIDEKFKGIHATQEARDDLQMERDKNIMKELKFIREQTTLTNGTVRDHCTDIARIQTSMKNAKSIYFIVFPLVFYVIWDIVKLAIS